MNGIQEARGSNPLISIKALSKESAFSNFRINAWASKQFVKVICTFAQVHHLPAKAFCIPIWFAHCLSKYLIFSHSLPAKTFLVFAWAAQTCASNYFALLRGI